MTAQHELPTLNPMTACRLLKDEARILPPYLNYRTEPKPFAGPVVVLSVFEGTRQLDLLLPQVSDGRVVVIDAQCQTHTSYFGPTQLRQAMQGHARAVIVFGAICNPAMINERARIPVIAMGTTPRMAEADVGELMRHRCQTDIGIIVDEGPNQDEKSDCIIGSDAGLVIAKIALVRSIFGDAAV
jgi:regulator of RNase E activity RraA